MHFTQDIYQREMEKLMQSVPNFSPRGCGVIVVQIPEIPPPTFAEVMLKTVAAVNCPTFFRRLNQYLNESELSPMMYKNDKHKAMFEAAVRKDNKRNYAFLSAVYLLTADHKLWMTAKYHIRQSEIYFDSIILKNSAENAYTLFCCAKDLYLGTKHMTVSDLADSAIVPPKVFALVCNAMAIRRFGLGALETIKNGEIVNG
ncbi:MAG: hypothetical protein HFE77_05300 [Clostridiales bacterium]|nr:hypothetical protein [Clostridiales bacterium]